MTFFINDRRHYGAYDTTRCRPPFALQARERCSGALGACAWCASSQSDPAGYELERLT